MPRSQRAVLRPRPRRRAGSSRLAWTAAALLACLLYRSLPHDPDPVLTAAVEQHLRLDYSERRSPEMRAHAARHEGDALLDVADDLLNSRVAIDSIRARGPVLPFPLPRRVVVRVHSEIRKGRDVLETGERVFEFGRTTHDGWRFERERRPVFYWLYPL